MHYVKLLCQLHDASFMKEWLTIMVLAIDNRGTMSRLGVEPSVG